MTKEEAIKELESMRVDYSDKYDLSRGVDIDGVYTIEDFEKIVSLMKIVEGESNEYKDFE